MMKICVCGCGKEFKFYPSTNRKYFSKKCFNNILEKKEVNNLLNDLSNMSVADICDKYNIARSTVYRKIYKFIGNTRKKSTYCIDCNKNIFYNTIKPSRCIICQELQKKKISKKNKKIWRRQRRAKLKDIREIFTDEEWNKKLDETGGMCPSCNKFFGIDKLTIDHIFPVSKAEKGRIYTIEDVRPLCALCNSIKGDKIA